MAAGYASLSWSLVAVGPASSTARSDIDPVFKTFDHPDSVSVFARLPGLRRKDVIVEIDQDLLHIRGQRIKGWLEPQRIAVERYVRLPEGLSADAATATLRDGVLTITVPKGQDARRRNIPIRVPGSSLGASWREAWQRFQERWLRRRPSE